ncbi:helix-turn-helix domain-containing protein [Pacificoceanicola onchidii]|uniref:helix-turn-helix domain-containing protein n=1 Tax=Pacificoceanicola onchidii TaxID=2562685 RepID=UPI001F0E091A|nr:helix-turn-helix domain-containing protein [Pacificoceanicola onchidii]
MADSQETQQGFDDFALKLGDVMRGERATMGKSLLDVQRELRIKASYIAAIENCDPSAFDTPGFIAGYVRSYARYLGMDPDEAFEGFCAESGFSVAHGMSADASTIRKSTGGEAPKSKARDPFAEPNMAFAPSGDSFLSRIEPSAIGSSLVLLALIGGIGYGGWTVLQEVQRVQLSPVEQTPVVLSELDPLDAANAPAAPDAMGQDALADAGVAGVFTPPTSEAFDRLYRPQALDVPVLVARDAPISTLDPDSGGLFAGSGGVTRLPQVQDSALAAAALEPGFGAAPLAGQRLALGSGVTVVAARPAWVQIKEEAGEVLFSGILNAGDTFAVPASAADPVIKVGESGSVYFAVNGTLHGPAGPRGSVTEDLALDGALLVAGYGAVTAQDDPDLAPVVAKLAGGVGTALAAAQPSGAIAVPQPQVLAAATPGVTIVASREAWVRVKAPSGATLYEAIMQPGDTYKVPQTETPPTIRTGDAGAVYFAVNGQTYGPYGANGAIADNLALSVTNVTAKMATADLSRNAELAKVVAELNAGRAGVQE